MYIIKNCNRLSKTVNNSIDVAKLESGIMSTNFRMYNIIRVVEDITETIIDFAAVNNIEVVFDSCLPITVAVQNGNALGATIDPPPEPLVPALPPFNGQDCGGIRALGIQKNLLFKGKTEIIAGGFQKPGPDLRLCNLAHRLQIQIRDPFIF